MGNLKIAAGLFTIIAFCSHADAADRPVDFNTDIIPVLTKAGCNSGACHGAAIGRGGFKLSLYGGTPSADYTAIARLLEGRRINLAHPKKSLFLLKPTEHVSHEGGERFTMESESARRIQRWIAAGAPPGGKRQLTKLLVSPQTKTVEKPGDRVELKAMATFSDGVTENVSRFTVFTPEDPTAVKFEKSNVSLKAVLHRRGEHIVIARFLDRVVPMRIIVPLSKTKVDHSQQPRKNFIDELVLKKLETLRIPVSPSINDAAFLRRITIDLTGRLPTLAQRKTFLADRKSDKRARLINQILASDEFVDFWTLKFAKLLRIRSQPKEKQGALAYHRWLRKQIQSGTPFDKLTRKLLTAIGDTHEYGPANFYRTTGNAREQAEFVSELFMGARLRCANCHNHPLDRWKQDDYHGFAALFAKVKTGRVIMLGTRGEITHPQTGEPAKLRIPGTRFLTSNEADKDGRIIFADWLTARENPYFAKAIVNRLWKSLMSRGLVEPTDDLRATNPATHPELLNRLADDFVKHGYEFRHTLRIITNSESYARSIRPVQITSATNPGNAGDDRYYSRGITRPLEAEVLADAISDVTAVSEKYGDQPIGTRAVTLFDSKIRSMSLDILGRCDRTGSCETASNASGGLSQKLHLMNGALINRKIVDPNGRLQKQITKGMSARKIIDEFYLRALSRLPTSREWNIYHRHLVAAKKKADQQKILEDILWSILSCREFTTRQ
jgi:hypothetical protein